MALTLKATTGTASKYLALTRYPVKRGLRGLYFMGSAETNQLTNHVPGGASLVAVGAPTVNAHSVTVNYNVGYDTGLAESRDFTYVAVAKVPAVAAGRAFAMVGVEAKPGTPQEGCNLQIDVSTASMNLNLRVKSNGYNAYISTLALGAIPVGDVAFFAGRCNYVGRHGSRVWKGHSGVLTAGAELDFAYDRDYPTVDKVRIGAPSVPFAAGYQAGEVFCAAVHDVALTDAELAQVYAFLKSKYADEYGISTL
jgi:hypothetical protein